MKASVQARQRERLAQLKLLSTFEKPLEKKVAKVIQAQGKTAAQYYLKHDTVTSDALAKHKNDFRHVLIPFYTRVIMAFGARIRRNIKGIDTFQSVMQAWLTSRALTTIDDIDSSTLDIIRTIIKNGVAQGLSVDKISKSIADGTAYTVARPRARVIARTEMHTAAQEGQLQAAKATGVKNLVKTWTAALDSRTRPDHADADGQTVAIDADFTVGGESISRPGDGSAEESINCRCVCVFSVGTADGSSQ